MKVGIVGGGPAGMCAAIALAPRAEVHLFEGQDRVGKKLLSTGNGRCNILNGNPRPEKFHGRRMEIPQAILSRYTKENLEEFFHGLGLLLAKDERNRLYPASFQASTVVNLFRHHLETRGVQVHTKTRISKITPKERGFLLAAKEEEYFCDFLLLATGGRAAPKTGSDGGGYALAEKLGHRVGEILPSLVQLESPWPHLRHLKGTKIDTKVRLIIDGRQEQTSDGELLFTDYGLSGPPILDLSRAAVVALARGRDVKMQVRLLAAGIQGGDEAVENLLYAMWGESVEDFLRGVVHKKLHVILSRILDLSLEERIGDLSEETRRKLLALLRGVEIPISKHHGFSSAQTTCGGVLLEDLDENLMSRIHPGLYFAGELLDVDGDCGGFNLHWAFASARCAADAIGNEIEGMSQ